MSFKPLYAVTEAGDNPLCADPEVRDDLDAVRDAHGPNSYRIREIFANRYCVRCPVAEACLNFALENNEHGVWAGTSDNQRSRARGIMPFTHNLRRVHRADPTPAA